MHLVSWERATSGFLDRIGLQSIKSKIIVFALLATLIPSVTTGWLSYRNNRRAIDEQIVLELTSVTSHASRELELWLKERRYELRVLSSSYEVSENLEKLNRSGQVGRTKALALQRIEAYLGSIGEKFSDYEELVVLDAQGNTLTSSMGRAVELNLTGNWFDRVQANETVIGNPYWDETFDVGVMIIVERIVAADGTFLGAMAAKINFDEINGILTSYAKNPSHELYLVTKKGEIVISSRKLDGPFMASELMATATEGLFAHEMSLVEFRSFRGNAVMGALHTVPQLGWGLVAEKDRTQAYSVIVRLRNITLALISTALLGIGLAAYLLGLTIVSPLRRLTHGATKVARGDLDVNLPFHDRSEVGYMTEVFNGMVARLRKFRDENVAINQELHNKNAALRMLSITDSLTGLYNRTELPKLLEIELARAQQRQHSFSILMIDIDRFKRFNDTYGHQAGDDLLRCVAEVLKSLSRACDVAARYGGEEFLILLTETEPDEALRFAERLRVRVEQIRSQGKERVTISVGVASFPSNGDDVESIIRQADAALYRCKRRGRNQVAPARAGQEILEPIPG
ncbi:MAG: diguanylate cyclase [Acidobacteria bacterium]|nr:diguanylate cyclase [Acidobacteriota bacterium]